MLQATSKMVRPRLGRTGHEDKEAVSCVMQIQDTQHLGGKGLFSSTVNLSQ